MVAGAIIGMVELLFFFFAAAAARSNSRGLRGIDVVSYYWFAMTVLTFLWEASFIWEYGAVAESSVGLLRDRAHVWTSSYDLSYVLPWKLARIFYAEYAAYADREYMALQGDWSRVVEGTHALFCGFFSLAALFYSVRRDRRRALVVAAVAMSGQLMNSLLYMSNYAEQMRDPDSPNYIRPAFPAGRWLSGRPFMYVNLFWTAMPSYVLWRLLSGDTVHALDDEGSGGEKDGPPKGVKEGSRVYPVLEDRVVREGKNAEHKEPKQCSIRRWLVGPDDKVKETEKHKGINEDKCRLSDGHLLPLNRSDDATKGAAIEVEVGTVQCQ